MAPNPPTELALEPEFDWVVGCKSTLKPKFCYPPLAPSGANITSGFTPPMLRPMAVKGVPPGDVAIVLTFAAAAVAMVAIFLLPGDEGIALAFVAIAVGMVQANAGQNLVKR